MDLVTTIFIALGLSMDTFAVSIAGGLALKQSKIQNALKLATSFAGFQALMLVVGWLAGAGVRTFISAFDHWIAFAILTVVGCKMIYEALKLEKIEKEIDPASFYYLFVLSLATSMDALAVGFSFTFLNISIATPVIIIGLITFLVSLSGVYIGDKFGHFFEKKVEIVGGLILIAIGIKILVEHLR